MKVISIVSPCYNEIENLPDYLDCIIQLIDKFKGKICFQIIVVDDCSTDGSREYLKEKEIKFEWLQVIENPRNYGVYRATYNGLMKSTGDLVVPMFPVDLQDPPCTLSEMIELKLRENTTGVFGKKIKRNEHWLMEYIRNKFYGCLARISSNKINVNVGEFGIVDKWVIDEAIRRDDYYPFLRGIFSNISSDYIFLPYTWVQRKHGESKHNLFDLLDQAINAFVSNGAQLFRPITIIGFFLSFFSIVFALYNIFLYIFDKNLFQTPGIATLIVLVAMLFGFIFVVLGFLGEFILAIHSQVRGFDRVKNRDD